MESIDPLWVFGGIALIAGALLGALLCRRFTPTITDVDELRVKLEHSRSEMESYRADVNGHFSKTSDLVKELTEDYVKVYRHLSEGAQTLSDAPEFTQLLEQQKGKASISTDDEADAQDIAAAQVEEVSTPDDEAGAVTPDVSTQGDEAEATTAEVSRSGDSVVEDDDNEEALADADVYEPTDATDEDKPKAAGSEPRPDPVARTDTQ